MAWLAQNGHHLLCKHHLENKMHFSENPEKFPGCYYSRLRALQFPFLIQLKEKEGEINQLSLS